MSKKTTCIQWLLMACICSIIITSCKKGVAKIQVIKPVYNAGQLNPADTVIKHSFSIKSTGTADLKIDSVGGSCSCVDFKWDKTPIKPGESGIINVTVKPNTDQKGKMMQYVVVKTNSTTPFSVLQIFFIR